VHINLGVISKGYFFGAMAVSAIHTVHSFEKMGLNDGQQYLTPLAIDGLAFFALGLQSKRYSDDTNKIGLRLQIGAGIAQLASNLYAASSTGGLVLGLLVVGIYLLMEAISPRIKTRAAQEAAEALAEAERIAEAEAAKIQASRIAKNEAAKARRASRKVETQALENLLSAKPRRTSRAKHAADANV
jgi:hypothetical protein